MEERENRLTIKFIAAKTESSPVPQLQTGNKNCSRNNKRWNYGETFAFSAAFEYPLSAPCTRMKIRRILISSVGYTVGFSRFPGGLFTQFANSWEGRLVVVRDFIVFSLNLCTWLHHLCSLFADTFRRNRASRGCKETLCLANVETAISNSWIS